MTKDTKLTPADKKRLTDCEATLQAHSDSYQDVAKAVHDIHKDRLYRGTHSNFESYCEEKWQLSKTSAWSYVHAGRVLATLGKSKGVDSLRDSHCRELAKVGGKDNDERSENLKKLWKKLPSTNLTAKVIAEAREKTFPSSSGSASGDDNWRKELIDEFRRLTSVSDDDLLQMADLKEELQKDSEEFFAVQYGVNEYVITTDPSNEGKFRSIVYWFDFDRTEYNGSLIASDVGLAEAIKSINARLPKPKIPDRVEIVHAAEFVPMPDEAA